MEGINQPVTDQIKVPIIDSAGNRRGEHRTEVVGAKVSRVEVEGWRRVEWAGNGEDRTVGIEDGGSTGSTPTAVTNTMWAGLSRNGGPCDSRCDI